MSVDLTRYGGKKKVSGVNNREVWNFGWMAPEHRSDEHEAAIDGCVQEMPKFEISGDFDENQNRAVLWDESRAANNGKHLPVIVQMTGSCVGHGGGNAIRYTQCAEIVRLREPELPTMPFFLLPYGRSRYYSGDRGQGEGSSGAGFAKAVRVDGTLPCNTPGLPQFYAESGGITYGEQQELIWSAGDRIADNWLSQSRNFLIKTTAQMQSSDDVRQALQNRYACTTASDWGGRIECPVVGGVLLNERVTVWQHQMSILGWQLHPQLGELFYVMNSWGTNVHGTPPDDAPPGGFWVRKADIDYMCRQNEVFAFSQFNGFPAQTFNWIV